jgi:pyruvate/2-oxoglutarate dehydrogenase complex dihydrolipoamide acyltransferase (E2) component
VVHDGQIQVRPILPLRWTFDERIEDGLSAARSAELLRRRLEDPVRYLGTPEDAVPDNLVEEQAK